jgi:ribosomal protein S18 acetylase RimI-like enzyme
VGALAIRPARSSDVPALSELAKRTWSQAFGDGVSPEDRAAELEEKRSVDYFADALREETILVAEGDGALVGYVQFGDARIPEVSRQAGDQAVHRLYVDASYQGRGLGRRLIETALAHPRLVRAGRVYLQVWEQNERALRLYESLGFRQVGATRFAIGLQPMEDLVLRLDRTGAPSRR